MEGWEIALLAAAGYVAVSALVRLMLTRRDRLVADLRTQAESEARAKARQAKADKRNKNVA